MAGAPVWSESDLAKHRAKEKREKGDADLPEASADAANPLASVQSATVPSIGLSYNKASRMHPVKRNKRAQEWKGEVIRAVKGQLRRPGRFPVRIIWRTYIPSGRNERDFDGGQFTSKHGVDALEDLGIVDEDNPEQVESVLLEAPRRGEPMRTEIIIIEV